nr:alpha/beta fold hydrolase [Pannonibacter sp. XCT-53]
MRVTDHRIAVRHGAGTADVAARQWHAPQGNGPGTDTQGLRASAPEVRRKADLAPIILLHDSLGCIALWRDLPERLARRTGRTVIAYDRPGFGQSQRLHARPAPDFVEGEALGTFADVLAGLRIDTFIAAGHSVGGGMTLAIAAAWPDRCRAAITIAAQSVLEDRTRAGIRAAEAEFANPAMREKLARYHGARTDWVLDAWIGSWLSPAFDGWSLDAVLPAIRQPLLLIHGAQDEYGSPAQLQRIADRARGPVQSLLIEDAGHFPHRSHEAETLAAITAFLAEVEESVRS